jgi:hypothetical protein
LLLRVSDWGDAKAEEARGVEDKREWHPHEVEEMAKLA